MNKEELLSKIRGNIRETYDMPSLDDIKATKYEDSLKQFISMSETVGGKVVQATPDDDLTALIRSHFPEAKVISSNLPEITIANLNPDTVEEAKDLNGTDVGIIRGVLGVAENGCIWIPQTMKEKAVCFISEYLVIILDHTKNVDNMHEAYRLIEMNDYGYGTFISGPSKTADIAQALVMGAQAARGVTVILV